MKSYRKIAVVFMLCASIIASKKYVSERLNKTYNDCVSVLAGHTVGNVKVLGV
ncbi:MAG: hypothetical protein ACON5F_01475 [Jejuia sp.]